MNNKKVDDSTWKKADDIPKSNIFFIMSIVSFFVFFLSGCAITILPFLMELEDIKSIFVLYIFGFFFLSGGIFFLVHVIKQTKLRLNWNKKNKRNVQIQKLTTEEANAYLSTTVNPTYHNDAINKAVGTRYEAELKTDRYGNTYFKSKTRYGGSYYLGSLLTSMMLTISIIASIIGEVEHIKSRDYVNSLLFLLVLFILIPLDFYSIKELIAEFKEKMKVKKRIREGKLKKEKINIGTGLYRIVIYSFFMFMGFMLCLLIMQEIGHSSSPVFIEKTIIFIFGLFCTSTFILAIYYIYLMIKNRN